MQSRLESEEMELSHSFTSALSQPTRSPTRPGADGQKGPRSGSSWSWGSSRGGSSTRRLSGSARRGASAEGSGTLASARTLEERLPEEQPRRVSLQEQQKELPDLTDKIASMGLHSEYQRFRDGYLRWRQGSPHGISFELNAEALGQANPQLFNSWYPSFDVWHWRRTASYWIAITFLEGSLLFCAGCACSCKHWTQREHPWSVALTSWPVFVGGLHFLFGTYLVCFESMNLMKKDEDYGYWPFRWQSVREHYQTLGEKRTPYFVGISYFVGVLFYTPGMVLGFWEWPHTQDLLLITLPYIVGGALFAIGGSLECVENDVFTAPKCSLSCWAATLNFTGGLIFFVGGGFRLFSHFLCDFSFAVGCGLYAVGSVINLVQWKDEQFGLTFLSAVNKIARISAASNNRSVAVAGANLASSGGHKQATDEEEGTKFSMRGVSFVCLYCILSMVSVYNLGLMFVLFVHQPGLHALSNCCTELMHFILMHMVLIMHSAVVKPPKTQPYHALVIGSRYLAVFMGVNSIMTLVSWLPHVISVISGEPDLPHNWDIRPERPPPPAHQAAAATAQNLGGALCDWGALLRQGVPASTAWAG